MNKSKPSIKNVLSPSDSISVVVVILGIIIAVFIDEIEIKLIGVSISLLGIVAFFIMISQRLRDYLDNTIFKKTPQAPDLKITRKEGAGATRQVIESLEILDKDFDKVKKQESLADKINSTAAFNKSKNQNLYKSSIPTGYDGGDEGFRIVDSKSNVPNISSTIEGKKDSNNKAESNLTVSSDVSQIDYKIKADALNSQYQPSYYPEDDFSSFRIVENDEKKDNKNNIQKSTPKPEIKTKQQNSNISFKTENKPKPEISNKQQNTDREIQKENKKLETPQSIIEKQNCKKYKIDVPMSIFMDDSISAEEPRNEFAGLVSRALMVIRSMASTTTAAFFLVNLEKEHLILETFVTDEPGAIIDNFKLPMGEDIISQITKSGKPEILTEINPSAELDLIPYYKKKVGSKSFIGLPIFYQNSVLGVICADTKVDDAYDNLTVSFMGHFTKLIANLLVNYTEKYELKQASRVLDAICDIRNLLSNGESNLKNIAESFIKSAEEIFDYKSIGITCFDFDESKWKVIAYKNKIANISLEGKEIDLDRTMLGETIKRGVPLNLTFNANSPVRVEVSENKLEQGYFVSAPIISMEKIYGAVFFEAQSKSHVTSYDLKILESLADQAAVTLEQLYLDSTINSSTLIDNETGLINMVGFEKRLSEEMYKSYDFNIPISLLVFKIDNYSSFNPEKYLDRYNKVVNQIISFISGEIKPYDVFAKSKNEIFYLAMIGLPISDAQLWAENVRSKIAQKVLNIDKKKLSVTISCGIASNSKGDNNISLMEKAEQALDIASRKTNNVTLYG